MFSTPSTPAPANTTRTPSIISAGVVITGVLSSSGDIQVDGQVDGDVRCVGLTVGENGIIRGDVRAETIVVRGTVDGSIAARTVMVAAGGHIEGDILHQVLEVEAGAFVEGHFRHAADALAETLPEESADDTDRRRPGSPMRAVEDAPMKIAAAE
jgi:cytoskeletal protein CcmA (bactofilin family)